MCWIHKLKLSFGILISGALLSGCTSSEPVTSNQKNEPAKVMVMGSLHGYHKKNPNYTYEDLFSTVKNFNPDVVAVEIRPEDVEQDTAYLNGFYPYEMRELLKRFPDAKKAGFDWWGKELEGVKLSREILNDSSSEFGKMKALEKAIYQDSVMLAKLETTRALQQKQFEILKDATAAQLNDGRYDSVTALYYASYYNILRDTKYEPRATINKLRDEHIGKYMVEIIKQNPGKKIVFVTGADHRGFAIERIKTDLGEKVELVPVP